MFGKYMTAISAALILGAASPALALPGLDGDNNPIPGYRGPSILRQVPVPVFAASPSTVRRTARPVRPFTATEKAWLDRARGQFPN